jgi:predicted GNAT superfamily acetyltransferase
VNEPRPDTGERDSGLTSLPSITIRPLLTLEDAEACEDLQVAIWPSNPGSAGFSIPIHMLMAQMELSGAVIGAWDGEKMVGFLYGSKELDADGRLYHYSWLAGVLPEYRHHKIMEHLKYAHAEIARAQGAYKIIWTYDPLQGANARLNVHKLGGIVRSYFVNRYGVRAGGSPQNIGMPADRFLLEWFLDGTVNRPELPARSVAGLLERPDCQLVNQVETNEHGLQVIRYADLRLDSPYLLIEIPSHFEALRAHPAGAGLDVEWRLKTREIFLHYLGRGYTVFDFLSEDRQELRRNVYLCARH